jgi:type VI protein secretion system component Hcp
MNSARIFLAVAMAVVLMSSSVSLAVVPTVIGFQGRLVMSDGNPPPDNTYEIIFSMWNDPTGGSMLWSETQQVDVINGQFDVELGSENDIPMEELSLNYEKIELQMQVLGDSPMMPRIPLSSVPYALVASRIQGDVFTSPGSLSVGLEQPGFKWAELSGTTSEAKLSLGEMDEEQLGLASGDDGSHFFMVDSFFDVQYRIEMSTTDLGGRLTVANIGSSGEDGVSVDVDPNSSHLTVSNIGSSGLDGVSLGVNDGAATCGIEHEDIGGSVAAVNSSAQAIGAGLVVSNIGSSGQDGVSIGVDDNSATCGIEHEDIGGAISSANSSADSESGRHEVAHNLSQYEFSSAGFKADDSGASFLGNDTYFDISTLFDHHANQSEAATRIQADNDLNLFKREDKATPNLYQASCSGQHENGHSYITHLIDNQGSSGEYRWTPDVGDEVIVGFHASDDGGHVHGADTFTDIPYEFDLGTQELSFTKFLPDGTPVRAAQYGPGEDFVVDSFFDVDYRVRRLVDETGAQLTISNIGSSGEDGIAMLSDDALTSIVIKEEGTDRVRLQSDGTLSLLSLGDLDSEGRVDLVAGSSSGDLSVFFSDPFGKSGVTLGSDGGDGGGGRIALTNQPAGETVPIEIVALSLVSSEPVMAVRNPDYSPADPPVMEYEYDALNRLTQTIRDSETAPGESTKTSSDGFHVFDGGSDLHLDTRGLFFADAAGPTCTITPYGDVTLKRGVIMAQDLGTSVGIGGPSTGFKLFVDGDICATGSIGPCSDARYKKNVENIESALDMVSRLRGVRFDWRTDEFEDKHFSEKRQVGLIAQEVEKVIPELVNQNSEGFYSLDYARLTPILIEAVKEQQKTISGLQEKVEELSHKYQQLTDRRDGELNDTKDLEPTNTN